MILKTRDMLTVHDLMSRWGVTERTLRNWRRRGIGPRWTRLSFRCIRYRVEDVERWEKDHRPRKEMR